MGVSPSKTHLEPTEFAKIQKGANGPYGTGAFPAPPEDTTLKPYSAKLNLVALN